MKKQLSILLFGLFALTTTVTWSQEAVTFNVANLNTGEIQNGAGSMNLCWLLDSDIKRPRTNSMEQRINEMNIGSLRFPYGHLADNYLWDTPPFGGTLEPKVASSRIPANWSWATNPDGTFSSAMDFDEFMSLSAATNTEPLVVVNILSHKYNNGPTYETLKETAVEWVKYASQNNLDVAFWQIGNEVDHHQDLISKAEYVALYVDFVTAMKAEDPTIVCGPGILSNVSYFNDIMALDDSLVDFTSCHQYLFNQSWGNYEGWRDDTISGTTNFINNMQNAVNNSSKPDLPILITESNAWGTWDENSNAYLFKGLAYFDLLMEQQKFEDVKYTYMWNSHSPWNGGNEPVVEVAANAWFNDDDNEMTALGWASYILNNTALEKSMLPNSKINGKTHSYGTYSPDTGDMVVYLMNKDDVATSIDVTLENYTAYATYERWLFSGTSELDKYPTFEQTGTITFTANGFSTDLPPSSLVVLKLTGESNFSTDLMAGTPYYIENVGTNQRLQSNEDGNDLMFTAISDDNPRTEWELEDAGNDTFYIVNRSSNNRIRALNDILSNPPSVDLTDDSFTGDGAKWLPLKVDEDDPEQIYYLNNVQFTNRRLSSAIGVGSTNFMGLFMQWRFVEASLSNDEFQVENDFQLYPNPVKDSFTLSINTAMDNFQSLQIFNQLGQLVKTMQYQEDVYDISDLSSGLYILKINTESKSSSMKLIKK